MKRLTLQDVADLISKYPGDTMIHLSETEDHLDLAQSASETSERMVYLNNKDGDARQVKALVLFHIEEKET